MRRPAPGVATAGAALVVLVTFAALLWWTWGTWPDVLIDFGRELYVAWRVSEGDVLYRDVMYINGPLSPYLNALWFRLFGVGIATLAIANTALLVLVVGLLARLLATLGSPGAALVGCLVFLPMFAFAQQMPIGNYNFVAPYSHEITHGIVLALAALLLVERFARTGSRGVAAACGLSVGLALLTKPEMALAIGAATTFGCALALVLLRPGRAAVTSCALTFGGAVALPPVLACLTLASAMPLDEALANTIGGLRWLVQPNHVSSRFYLQITGLLDPHGAATRIGTWTVVWLVVLGGAAFVGARAGSARGRRIVAGAVFLVVLAGAFAFRAGIPWTQALMPLPLFTTACVLGFTIAAVRRAGPTVAMGTGDARERGRLVLGAAFSLLALVLLLKIVLRVRPSHYGFALAMPATMLLIAVVWDWLPRVLPRSADAMRGALVAGLVVLVGMHLQTTAGYVALKTVQVGSGADAMWADPRGLEVERVLDEIARVPRDATIAAIPAGAMLGYLSRHRSPVRYVDFDPFVMALYREQAMLRAFDAAPPDFVLLADISTREYGVRGFGDGYAEALAGWIGDNYEPVGPTEGRGLVLLRRTAASRAAGVTRDAAAP